MCPKMQNKGADLRSSLSGDKTGDGSTNNHKQSCGNNANHGINDIDTHNDTPFSDMHNSNIEAEKMPFKLIEERLEGIAFIFYFL